MHGIGKNISSYIEEMPWFWLSSCRSSSLLLFSVKWTQISFTFFLKKSVLFYIGVYLINNVVIVSGVQPREIAIHIHISPFLQASLPSSLPHNIGQNFMCCTVDPCWCREFGIDMYTLLYFKWINIKDQISFILTWCFISTDEQAGIHQINK